MKELSKAGQNRSITPFILAVVTCSIVLAFIISKILQHTNGFFSYPVDDAYIHMQIAKNLAFHGTWGINAGEFSSASSSILYTLLLAGVFRIAGDHLLIPFLVNAVAAIVLLYVIWRWLRKENISQIAQLVILLLVIFITPLHLLVMTGMEHTLQCLFSFLFLFRFADWLQSVSADNKTAWKIPAEVYIYALLTATIRYEGLFLVGMAILVLFWYRQFFAGIKLGIIAILPVFAFGIISVMKDSYFLPNSVLVKSEAAQFSIKGIIQAIGLILSERFTFSKVGVALLATQRLLFILPLAYLFFSGPLRSQRSYRFLLVALTAATFMQLALADTGKFYRYEAYLMLCSTVILSVLVMRNWKSLMQWPSWIRLTMAGIIVFFLFLPILFRTITANVKVPRAGINIYEQQYQMSSFLKKYYDGEAVAANDIGAIAYFTKMKVVDLWGLGNIDIARSKKGGYWTAPFLDSISREKGASVAIVYDSWIDASLPPSWKKAGEWKIQQNVVCGDDHVSFYAIDSTQLPRLIQNLHSYQPSLPPGVLVSYQ